MEINSPQGITENFRKPLWSVRGSDMYKLMLDLRRSEKIDTCYPFGQYHHVVFKKDPSHAEDAKEVIATITAGDLEVRLISPTIEDRFMELMTQ